MIATTTQNVPTMAPVYGQGPQLQPAGNLAFSVSTLSEWQVRTLQEIATFELLHANWDSYGSPPPADNVLEFTRDLVARITVGSVPAPRIIPISGGGIQLYWEKGDREIEIKLHSDLTVGLLVVEGEKILLEVSLPSLSPPMVDAFLSWLIAPH